MGSLKTVEDQDLVGRYQAVREQLLGQRYSDRMSKPLAYWVLPSDRRLPLAFLNRSLGELLSTPFQELSATPGIGEKKINSLVKLLHRATHDRPPAVPVGESGHGHPTQSVATGFDPALVSEALWSDWRDVVRRNGVGDETLGRLAPSLQNLPTVIWEKPLSQYLDHTVAEIRRLRTHGEKRVRCVLEVFHSVAERLAGGVPSDDRKRLLTPPLIREVEDWCRALAEDSRIPEVAEVREHLADPVLKQIHIDSGDTVHSLAVERLGLSGSSVSVRSQARNLGVTRARIYQLLDDCSKVMTVRWPNGAEQLESLALRFASAGTNSASNKLFFGVRELCFPDKKKDTHRSDDAMEVARQEEDRSLAVVGATSS